MPRLTIDERTIDVAPGTKVIEAAARLGIMIPRFCYHPALGSVGACRMCAVAFQEGPVKGLQMSCMVDAADGMVVSTTDAEAVEFRRYVIEWLMLNHPHDCPVCDEGGHCLLQETTVSGGHGLRRYSGRKRTYPDQDLGPLVQHEMNRCIHCYRCTRFYQEYCGYRDLGALRLGHRTYFGRVASGTLQSPFAGNLSDVCPTGVYTDKPARFFGRRWDYQRTATLCIHCALGCHTTTSVRYRQVVRQEARFSAAVNGHFICDRGRFGFFYASRPDRPRQARINAEPVGVEQALAYARERLDAIRATAGPQSVAAVGSVRSSLETQAVLARAAKIKGWRGPAFFADSGATRKVQTAVTRLAPELSVSPAEIESADFVLVVGADPVNEAPMLALSLRQAFRKGARVVVVDPRPVSLPFDFAHIALPPEALGSAFLGLVKAGTDPGRLDGAAAQFHHLLPEAASGHAQTIADAGCNLRDSRRPVIVCGTDIPAAETVSHAADAALLLAAAGKKAGLFYAMPGANAFGAGLLVNPDHSLTGILEAVEQGAVRALILVESDPFTTFPDRGLLERALSRLELLIVLDHLASAAAARAQVFLPTQTLFEGGGLFVNAEGRVQASLPAGAAGSPVTQVGNGSHPPRIYGAGLPGADPRPAWQLVARLSGDELPEDAAAARGRVRRHLCEIAPELSAWGDGDAPPADGVRLAAAPAEGQRFGAPPPAQGAPVADGFDLLFVDSTFGTEELSAGSACLEPLAAEPFAGLNRWDAAGLGVADGDRVSIRSKHGALDVRVKLFENMACGVIVVPRHRKLAWQALGHQLRVGPDDVRKVGT